MQFTLPEQSDWCANMPIRLVWLRTLQFYQVNVSRPYFSTRPLGTREKIWCLGTRLGGSLQCFPELLTELWYIEVIVAACITHHILVERSFWPAAGTTLWLVLPYLVQALLQTWPLPFSSGLSASAWAGMGGGIHAWGHMCVTIQNIDQILPSSLQNCVWLVCFEVKIEASEKASSWVVQPGMVSPDEENFPAIS